MSEPIDGEGRTTWAQLRRRKVVQWGVGYLAAAWGFLQGLEYLSETYGWTTELRKFAILALLLGLPIVLVVAWYHGDRGHQRVHRTEVAILTLLTILSGGVLWYYQPTGEIFAPPVSTSVLTTVPGGGPAAAADPRPSIAVLPFDNSGTQPDDESFVDGIYGDILMQLSRIGALRVIARTSVEQLRGSELGTREIATRLGVATILRGGVQRSGDRVRVRVEFIDANTDAQLWAESYDRKVTMANVFSIQTEVAAAIFARLQSALALPMSTAAAAPATQSLEAWELRQLAQERWSTEGLAEAEELLRRAIAVDSGYAEAYIDLARTLMARVYAAGARRDLNFAEAQSAAQVALQLAPNLDEAWQLSAIMAMEAGDTVAAEARFRKVIELNPNFAGAYEKLSDLAWDKGDVEDSTRYAEAAAAIDPLSFGIVQSLARNLEATGRIEEAAARLRRFVDINPDEPGGHVTLGEFEAYSRNHFADAVQSVERAVALDPDNANVVAALGTLYLDLGNNFEATRLTADATERWPYRARTTILAAWLAVYRGDWDTGVRLSRKILETNPQHFGAIALLAQSDLTKEDYAAARARYAIAYPELVADHPTIDAHNVGQAIALAAILLAKGETDRAHELLDRGEDLMRGWQRLGTYGYGISDARILALRGDRSAALGALREAANAGWRGPYWRIQRDFNLAFAGLHDDPQFKAVFADIERDMSRQLAELAARPRDTLH